MADRARTHAHRGNECVQMTGGATSGRPQADRCAASRSTDQASALRCSSGLGQRSNASTSPLVQVGSVERPVKTAR